LTTKLFNLKTTKLSTQWYKGPVMASLRALLRLGFRLLYNEFAWTYDLVSWSVSAGQWRSWQRAALPYLRGRKVLEVAHGTGNLLLDLAALGFEPVGFDLSRAMGKIARRKLRSRGLERLQVPLVRGQVQALPFARDSFPSILSTFPTEFIVDSGAIAEFHRVLQPGGVMVFVPSAQITSLGLADRLAEWLFRVTGQSSESWFAPLLGRYTAAGFRTRLERVQLPRSRVTVVVAEKLSG
jgi:ubiquinone/menaquinone biosynthesis C-methylase UbiE